jgi:hypothetical protein
MHWMAWAQAGAANPIAAASAIPFACVAILVLRLGERGKNGGRFRPVPELPRAIHVYRRPG